jgi:putative oxidoreductase
MTTNAMMDTHGRPARTSHSHAAIDYLVPLGRLLFVAIFIMSAPMHFKGGPMIDHASQAGVPMANILVPLSGIIAGLGGLSILLGFHARWGAWLLVLFLVPVTITMHRFWGIADPQATMMQQAHFMKNMSLLGAALLIAYFGSGPFSVDSRHHA